MFPLDIAIWLGRLGDLAAAVVIIIIHHALVVVAAAILVSVFQL